MIERINILELIKKNKKQFIPVLATAILSPIYVGFLFKTHGLAEDFIIAEKWMDFLGEGFCAALSFIWIVLTTIAVSIRGSNNALLSGSIILHLAYLHDLMDEFIELPEWGGMVEDIFFPLGMILMSIGAYNTVKYQTKLLKEVTFLKDKYSKLSLIDELTGLYNVRYLYNIVEKKIFSIGRKKEQIFLAMIDVDDFKKYNDKYGHLEGDKVLSIFAKTMIENLSESDLAIRYGGEEFIAVVHNDDYMEVINILDGIREKFSRIKFSNLEEGEYCSVSIGISKCRSDDDLQSLIHRADTSMYVAKKNGKNKVVFEAE